MAHTMQSFTKRQRVLLDRLVTFGQWLSEKRLPVSVLEAYGFGSFFRGKGRPHDVDILLRRSTEDTDDFRLFSKLLDKVSYGRTYRKFKTPQAALLNAFDQHYSNLIPGLIDVSVQRAVFGEWIEGYTWKMLSTSDIAQEITLRSDREIARRFVKRNLPNLNISWWIGPDDSPQQCGLRATFIVLFWSKDKPDVRANVEAALLDGDRHNPILEELAQFDHDIFRLETQIDLVKKAVERLLRTPRSRKPADSSPAWLRAWANRQKGLNGKALETAIFCDDQISEERIIEHLGLQYPQSSYDGLLDRRFHQLFHLAVQLVGYRSNPVIVELAEQGGRLVVFEAGVPLVVLVDKQPQGSVQTCSNIVLRHLEGNERIANNVLYSLSLLGKDRQ